MKRSKIFLSVTTCLLAIAAFAASKASRNSVAGFYTSGGSCHSLSAGACFTKGSGTGAVTCTVSGHKVHTKCSGDVLSGNKLYTANSGTSGE